MSIPTTEKSMTVAPGSSTRRSVPAVRRVATPMEMLDRALSSGMAPEVIGQLMALQERWQRNVGKMAFDNAIALAKAELPKIVKKRKVDFTGPSGKRTNYEYEAFADIAEAIDPVLGRHGLSYRFRTDSTGQDIVVTGIISHKDGYSEENSLSAPRDVSGNKNPIQAIGSTVTFLERYVLKAALGLAAAPDDDTRSVTVELMNPQQMKTIEEHIIATGANRQKFLALQKVENLAELPADRFQDLMKQLDLAKQARERNTAAGAGGQDNYIGSKS